MTPLRRNLLAFAGSLALHVGPSLGGVRCGLDVDLEMPDLEIEITEMEIVDIDQQLEGAVQPPPPVEEVIPPPMGPDKPPESPEGPAPAEEKPPEPPKPKFGEKTSRVAELGPASSNFFMLLNAKKVAPLPFADEIVEIMAPLPDFDFIVAGGGFHPLRDFNFLVIASPNLRDLTQTFLAVEFKLTQQEMMAGLDRAAEAEGERIEWETRDGRTMGNPKPIADPSKDFDPRWFVFLDDNVAVYVREEFLPAVTGAGTEEVKAKTAGDFVANLTKLRTFAAREPRAGLQLVLKDLHAAIKLKKEPPFPIPNNLELMAEAAAEPELVIKSEYLDAVDATKMERQWTEDLPRFIDDKVPFYARFMVRSFYEQTTVSRDDKALLLRADFTKDQAKFILEQIAGQSARMLRRTPEQLEARRKAREELWQARKNGKLTPSQVYDKQQGKSGAPQSGDKPVNPPTGEGKPAPGETPKPPPQDPPAQDGGAAPTPPPAEPAPEPAPDPLKSPASADG